MGIWLSFQIEPLQIVQSKIIIYQTVQIVTILAIWQAIGLKLDIHAWRWEVIIGSWRASLYIKHISLKVKKVKTFSYNPKKLLEKYSIVRIVA